MNDVISIRDLEVHYRVGVPREERETEQRLLLTVDMEWDFGKAACSDMLEDTIDYFAVVQRLLKFGEGREWRLIEKLAADIGECVCRDFGALAATVEVKKFIIPDAKWVSVRRRTAG
ncbi:MAG: dihydroneopterin aldolase [Verrucomicrobiales bacterium]|nr:dihydroneopterin aldolase [Verrucomicrobiales bacterium]|tara:strand:+ start:62943 stop:63293 length:351 start_codon:yes stop_codon:yes gene_type:complete